MDDLTGVLVPYKITLLSNDNDWNRYQHNVLVPYKITLLSNAPAGLDGNLLVLVPYKITLLSNQEVLAKYVAVF